MPVPASTEYFFEHLHIRSCTERNVKVFVLEGSVDASNLPKFEDAIMEACKIPNAHVLVDCAKLTHLSSSGIGSFYRFFNASRSSSGTFSICAVPNKILAVMNLVGLTRVLKPIRDRQSAVAERSAPEDSP